VPSRTISPGDLLGSLCQVRGIAGPIAEDSLLLILAPGGSELIQFGQYSYGPACLDPATGTVVDLAGTRDTWIRGPMLVNSTLDRFIRTVRTATELFPYQDHAPTSSLTQPPRHREVRSNRSIRLHGITTDSGAASTGALEPANMRRTTLSPRPEPDR
jgi:SUKH-4 immunity protein